MSLSKEASLYLLQMHRENEFISDKTNVTSYLIGQNIPTFDKVIDFQINLSGLDLSVHNKPGDRFSFRLFSKNDIEYNVATDIIKIDNHYYFYCGDHATAQYWFVLADDGQICTYDNGAQKVNPIYSSAESMIENYALSDQLAYGYECPFYFDLKDPHNFNDLVKDSRRLAEANDEFNEWVSYKGIVIHKGRWLDRASFFLHFYGSTSMDCESFVNFFKTEGIL